MPNLLEPGAGASLVISQDVDLAIPVALHDEVKRRLDRITRLVPSAEEPSVCIPRSDAADLIEVNFIGSDPLIVDPIDTYEKEDARLPLMVFGPLSLLVAGPSVDIGGLLVPVPRPARLALETRYAGLAPELRNQIRSNLSILSLLPARLGMPAPAPARATIASLLLRLEAP